MMGVKPSSRKARIAVVCASDGSLDALLKAEILATQRAGYRVEAVCSDGPYVAPLRRQGLFIHTVEIVRRVHPLKDVKALFQLWRLFRRRRYDIVHTHTPKAAFLGIIAAKLAGTRVTINTVHGLYYQAFPPGLRRWMYKMLEASACRLANHVFSQSREDVALLRDERLVPARRLEWLGNGINLDRFHPDAFSPGEGQRVRREFDIPLDGFVVGIVARMVTEKGFRELFEAFAILRKSAPNAYLLHIGFIDRSRNDEVTPHAAQEYGIAEHCRFVGQRFDIARLMTAMDVFCLPSYREGYPRSVMEANALGVPAVVTDIRGCREAVIPGENGLLVPVRQSKPLADALLRLYSDVPLRMQLGRGARGRAEREFDERRVIGRVHRAYRDLLAAPATQEIKPIVPSSRPLALIVTAVPGTVVVFLTEQIEGMRRAGYDVTVVSSPGPLLDRLRGQGLDCHAILIPRAIRPVRLLMALVQLYKLFRARRPNLVHTHTPLAALLGQVASFAARVPARITTVHGLYYLREDSGVMRTVYRVLEIVACRLATRVISVSEQDSRYLVQVNHFPEDKVETFHVGVNLNEFNQEKANPSTRAEVRAECDIPQDAFVFGIVARMVREKGFAELFEAFAALAQRHSGIYLLHVGPTDDGRDHAVTPRDADAFGCGHLCRFVGMRHDVARYLSAMDVFCLPTYREGYPTSIMEAAAVGLPSITTDIRGCREAVLAGQTGVIIPPRHVKALEAAMEYLLTRADVRQTMATAALARAHDHFDRQIVVQRTLSLYSDELRRHPRLTRQPKTAAPSQ